MLELNTHPRHPPHLNHRLRIYSGTISDEQGFGEHGDVESAPGTSFSSQNWRHRLRVTASYLYLTNTKHQLYSTSLVS